MGKLAHETGTINPNTVEVRLSGTRLTGKFGQPDLIGKKIIKLKENKKFKKP